MAHSALANTQISQLYVALFGRAPDAGGLDFWTGLLHSGSSLSQVADAMFGTEPARGFYPNGLGSGQIVDDFYLNVLGRLPDSGGREFWVAKLTAEGATPGSVISEMVTVVGNYAGSDPAGVASAALFNNRTSAAQFYAEHGGSVPYAASVIAAVTGDAASVVAARALFLGAGSSGTIDVGGFATVTTSSIDDRLVLANADEAASWTITATGTLPTLFAKPMDFVLTDASGLHDAVPITLTSHGAMQFWGLSLPGIEHLSFANVDTDGSVHENHVVMTQLDGLQSVTVAGNANFRFDALMNTSLRNFDASLASGKIDYVSTCLAGGSIVRGGSGDDWLSTIMSGDTIVGGAGNDNIACAGGAATLTGGSGADTFRWQTYNSNGDAVSTITDFAPGEGDRISFMGAALGDVVDPNFSSSPVVLPGPMASWRDHLDAATQANIPAAGPSLIRWFQYEGDTYVTVDNSSAATFQDGTDGVIRLAGLVDLGTGVAVSYFALGA